MYAEVRNGVDVNCLIKVAQTLLTQEDISLLFIIIITIAHFPKTSHILCPCYSQLKYSFETWSDEKCKTVFSVMKNRKKKKQKL